jgi:predicted neutral ceramidase superfamily lipid hydrolase
MNLKEFCSSGSELKRKLEESFSEDVKRRKIDGDVFEYQNLHRSNFRNMGAPYP